MEVVAAERVDVGAGDGSDARDCRLVREDAGLGGVKVADGGGHVAGVPDLDGVDEELEAEAWRRWSSSSAGIWPREPMTRWRRSAWSELTDDL